MRRHKPPPPAARIGALSNQTYAQRPTAIPGVTLADYSNGRLSITPDLSRIQSTAQFDTFALLNPWLAEPHQSTEECYWEVTVLTPGLMQIGAAMISSLRYAQLFTPGGENGVGDVGFSVGIDLSRKTFFWSAGGNPLFGREMGAGKEKFPMKWSAGDTLSFHLLPSLGVEHGRCVSTMRVWFTNAEGGTTPLYSRDYPLALGLAEPAITLQCGQAVAVNIGQQPFRYAAPPAVRSFLDVVTDPRLFPCVVCRKKAKQGFRCIDCPSSSKMRDGLLMPYRSQQSYCAEHFARIAEDLPHMLLCHRWAYFDTEPGYSTPQTLIAALQPPGAFAVPWSRYLYAFCGFCQCTKAWCWLRSMPSPDLLCCFKCFDPTNEDMQAAMPWVAMTNPAACMFTARLGHFVAPPSTEPLPPKPSAYNNFDLDTLRNEPAPLAVTNYARPVDALGLSAQSQPQAYASFDPANLTSSVASAYSQASGVSGYASSEMLNNAQSNCASSSAYSSVMDGSSPFDYETEAAAAGGAISASPVSTSAIESRVGSLAQPDGINSIATVNRASQWNISAARVLNMPDSTPEEMAAKIDAFRTLRTAFSDTAFVVAKTVVAELALVPEQKSIKPVDVGGVAGGTKYIHNGIFLKFAVDSAGIYGGNSFAAKSAALELRGLRSYLECNIPDLNIPLMAVLDYKGWTMIATPLLPVTSKTLVYGSNDAGRTVHKSDPHMNHLMELAAQRLNLKLHKCGIAEQVEELAAPTDIEGHRGTDGLYYVLDTARVCPPEKPFRSVQGLHILQSDSELNDFMPRSVELLLKAEKWRSQVAQALKVTLDNIQSMRLSWDADVFFTSNGKGLNAWASLLSGVPIMGDALVLFSFGSARSLHFAVRGKALYCLLRPELVRAFPKPLSSDSYTMFGRDNSSVHNTEVAEATDYIRNAIIPGFVTFLYETRGAFPVADFLTAMHKRGIPLRFLGAVATMCPNDGGDTWSALRCLITLVTVARAFKIYVRSLLRECRSDDEYRHCVVDHLNLLLGSDAISVRFYETLLLASTLAKFGKYGLPDWLSTSLKKPDGDEHWRAILFLLVEPFLGVRFQRKFRMGSEQFEKFHCTPEDMDAELCVRVRTVYDEVIRSKEETLLEVSRMPGFNMSFPAVRLWIRNIPFF